MTVQTYGDWRLVSEPYTDNLGRRVVQVECVCGTRGARNWSNIRRGLSNGCGCARKVKTPVSPGNVYGDWTVLAVCSDERYIRAECACGYVRERVYKYSLAAGDSRSCGHEKQSGYVFQDGTPSARGHNNRGRSRSKLRAILARMIERCTLPESISWKDYGARGIRVCDEWVQDPDTFIEWSLANGYEYGRKLQIDRIDYNGDYEPGNCRWVDVKTNARNKRNTVWLTAWGESKTLMDWVEDPRCLISEGLLRSRVEREWPSEEAMTLPVNSRKPN